MLDSREQACNSDHEMTNRSIPARWIPAYAALDAYVDGKRYTAPDLEDFEDPDIEPDLSYLA